MVRLMCMQIILRRASLFLIVILLAQGAFAQTRVISVAAGDGNPGFAGDGGPATSAQVNGPSDVAIDTGGNFYVADRNNNRVRKVSVDSGNIDTFAGSGLAGWFFSGGPAIFASLDHPTGVAVAADGTVFIADLLENNITRISKVDTSGNIFTLTLPMILNGAVAIALDSHNNLYIAEEAGHRIDLVDLGSGSVTTVAGTGAPGFAGDGGPATSAALNGPVHLALDAAGNLYFTDSKNNRIRKVSTTGIITTVAGSGPENGPGGFGGDGGPATSAKLNNPRGVAVDAAGDLLIADTQNRRIRKVNANTGVITSIAGGPENGCSEAFSLQTPDAIAVNDAGNFIYVSDGAGNRVWKISLPADIAPPTLSSLSPSSGILGTTVVVTVAGTGFVAGGGATGLSCNENGTTVFVAGAGVTVTNITVTNSTSLTASFVVAPNAALGPHDVTVTTDGGTSAAVPFTVTQATPAPTLSSITPPSNLRGSTATLTLVGTNFDTRAGGTTVAVGGTGISISGIQIASPTTLTAVFTFAPDAVLGNHSVTVATAGGTSNAMPLTIQPTGPTFVYNMPNTMNPTDQTPVQVSLASTVSDPVTATLTLTFAPNAVNPSDDPNVTFVNATSSARTMTVTFAPNSETAQLSMSGSQLQAGTVAGTIQLSMTNVRVGGTSTASSGGDFGIQVPRLVPIITNLQILNVTTSGFEVQITGYSTSRDISAATFTFAAASGQKLITLKLQPEVSSSFGNYFQSDASQAVGGAFVYTQPFMVQQGTISAVAAVTVSLTNAQGTSDPQTANVQ
jgi:sugar lactone lactonase YvrE